MSSALCRTQVPSDDPEEEDHMDEVRYSYLQYSCRNHTTEAMRA